MAARLSARDPGFAAAFEALVNGRREQAADVETDVAAIIRDVRARGDVALIAFTETFDRLKLTPATLAITADDFARAEAACPQAAPACYVQPGRQQQAQRNGWLKRP